MISGIYKHFTSKWDQKMLCLDDFSISEKCFNDATDAASWTCHKKLTQYLGMASLAFLVLCYPY